MAKIFVYNHLANRMEVYYRGESEPMPYSLGRTLTVEEFRGSSRSSVLWTDRRAMAAWNAFRSSWGQNIFVGFAFNRIWQGGHSAQSQHYAGVAFDVGQNLSNEQRARMRILARNLGVWSYVEPVTISPRWVHVDKRLGTPACAAGGYPALRVGSKGVYVLIFQDALNALGYTGSGLDGNFGNGTRNAVLRFQTAQGLARTGTANCETWLRLTSLVNGIGRTRTVVSP